LGAGLRHVDGVSRAVVRRWTGYELLVPATVRRLTEVDETRVRLRPEGFALADAIVERVAVATLNTKKPRPTQAPR
jgi:hypothetical protein